MTLGKALGPDIFWTQRYRSEMIAESLGLRPGLLAKGGAAYGALSSLQGNRSAQPAVAMTDSKGAAWAGNPSSR